MIRAEQIPDEVVEAAAKAIADDAKLNWDDVPYAHNVMRGEARAAIAAALNAWPGGQVRLSMFTPQEEIILPLPAEANDE